MDNDSEPLLETILGCEDVVGGGPAIKVIRLAENRAALQLRILDTEARR